MKRPVPSKPVSSEVAGFKRKQMFALLFIFLGLSFQTAFSTDCPKTLTGIELRQALDRQQGAGFGILAAHHSPPALDLAALREEFSQPGTLVLHAGRQRVSPGTYLTQSGQMPARETFYRPLRTYVDELGTLMNLSLPGDEPVIVSGAELRVGLDGVEAMEDLDWHKDGDYMAVAVVLSGSEMQYSLADDKVHLSQNILKVPLGKPLIYSCERRAARHGTRSLMHRHVPNSDSVLLIVRFSHVADAGNR
jgi:hypothetical protein